MTESAISTKDKHTVGEELFLVHLKRCREEELEQQDHDILGPSPPRKRSNSKVGEELWEIHLKRSQGRVMEEDLGQDEGIDDTSLEKKEVSAPLYEAKICTRYNLRSKDAPRKKA
jgi:hypothetical protein